MNKIYLVPIIVFICSSVTSAQQLHTANNQQQFAEGLGACIDSSLIDPNGICPMIYAPVCGCDGITYSNDCIAQKVGGVTSWTPGACGALGCIDETLIDLTALCPAVYDPVCGCNGITYNNDCEATYYGGVTSWIPGECGSVGCINPQQIDSNMICPAIYLPVCGCNGVTYGNDCEATYYGGVTSWTPGECGSSSCVPYYNSLIDGYSVQFFDASSGPYNAVLFDFGDGTTSTQNNPIHLYSVSGSYNVCITISGASCEETYCNTIVIESACFASFLALNNCDNSLSIENMSNAENADYSWVFGDGTSGSDSSMIVYHNYPASGFYNVCLTVNGTSCNETLCDTVYVFSESNMPGFFETYNPSATLPVTVNFEVALVIPLPYTYTWNLGDGTVSSETIFTHTYTSTCTPTVCLTVAADSCSKVTCKTLDICTTTSTRPLSNTRSIKLYQINNQLIADLNESMEPAYLKIADLSGRVIYTEDITENKQSVIDVQGLLNGIYLATLTQKDQSIIIKFFKY